MWIFGVYDSLLALFVLLLIALPASPLLVFLAGLFLGPLLWLFAVFAPAFALLGQLLRLVAAPLRYYLNKKR